MTPPEAVAAGALLWALLQLIVATWRDLGAMTVAVAGAAVVLAEPEPSAVRSRVAVWLVVAGAVAAAAWIRGAARGVGRPSLVGASLFAALVGGLVPWLVPDVVPARFVSLPTVLVPELLVGALATLAAMERPAARPDCTRWYRVVPIEVEARKVDVEVGSRAVP